MKLLIHGRSEPQQVDLHSSEYELYSNAKWVIGGIVACGLIILAKIGGLK